MEDDFNVEGAGGEQQDVPFSPFNAPVVDKKGPGGSVPDGVKMEEISEAEATGQQEEIQSGGEGGTIDDGTPPGGNPGAAPPPPPPPPMDAPVFTPPNFGDVPNADIPPADDPLSSDDPGGSGGTTKVPDGFGKEFADYTAQWLVDIFFRIFLQAVRTYCKIDRTEVLRAINQGLIHPKFLGFIDKLNKKADVEIDVTDEEKKFIIEPLKQFIVIKKIEVKPEWMMLGSLVMVAGSIAMRAHDLKNQNAELLQQLLKESAEIRRGGGGGAAGSVADIPTDPDPPGGGSGGGIDAEDFTRSATSESSEEGGFTSAN